MKKQLLYVCSLFFVLASCEYDKTDPNDPMYQPVKGDVVIDATKKYQVMDNFGASDCWWAQFVGKNWPDNKKEQIADWLFSLETDKNGKPEGIGLSLWRFNVGAGSAEQGSESGIATAWRRSECFQNADGTYDWEKQAGQRWFLKAAKERGVEQFLCFPITAPVHMTANGLGYNKGRNGTFNIKPDSYPDFAAFMADVIKGVKEKDGIEFNYISPFNEPEWNWDGNSQEGTPALNSEVAKTIRLLNEKLMEYSLNTKIMVSESGQYDYMYKANTNLPGRDNQINDYFTEGSANYIGNLQRVPRTMAGHAYWTTAPVETMIQKRKELSVALKDKGLKFWQTELCMMAGDSEIGGGNGKDLSMDFALYVARLMHYDITAAQASAWHWWLGATYSDYKDGMIYIGDSKTDGTVEDSKFLWTFGNFSRFIRPGAVRIDISSSEENIDNPTGLMISAYLHQVQGELIVVALNYSSKQISFKPAVNGVEVSEFIPYVTSDVKDENLTPGKKVVIGDDFIVPSRSAVTFVAKIKK